MGMTIKYSKPIFNFAESVDANEHDCKCNECHDCCLGDWLRKTAEAVSALEMLYDEKIKELNERGGE